MGRTLTFSVPGRPVAKQRVRHYVKGNTGLVGSYTPAETRQYESLVAMCAREAQVNVKQIGKGMESANYPEVLRGPLKLVVEAFFTVPDSRSKGKHKLEEGAPHIQRPDADNILKAICDGCNSVVWNDDCSVYHKTVVKRWTYAPAYTQVTVEEL